MYMCLNPLTIMWLLLRTVQISNAHRYDFIEQRKCFRKVKSLSSYIGEQMKTCSALISRKQKVNKFWHECVRDKSKPEKKTRVKIVRHPARGAHTHSLARASLTQRERPLLSPGAHTNKFALSAHFSRDFARGLIERDCWQDSRSDAFCVCERAPLTRTARKMFFQGNDRRQFAAHISQLAEKNRRCAAPTPDRYGSISVWMWTCQLFFLKFSNKSWLRRWCAACACILLICTVCADFILYEMLAGIILLELSCFSLSITNGSSLPPYYTIIHWM